MNMADELQARALAKPLLIITAILAVIHFLIFQISTNSLEDSHKMVVASVFSLALILMPAGVLVSYTAYRDTLKFMTYFSYIWLGAFHLLFHLSLVELVLQIVRPHSYSHWVLAAAASITAWSLYKGLKFPAVRNYQVKAPEFLVGKKIVQVSDLHVGMLHLNQRWLQKVVDKINFLNPDFVAITGDLVEGAYAKISPQLEPLKQLRCSQKYYVTGNHEYIHFSESWEERLQELGFSSLHNSAITVDLIGGKLMVAGVPDRMAKRFTADVYRSDPDRALKTTDKVDYKILLAHQPSSVFDLRTERPDLILSGHTHGGQIFPFSLYVRMVQPLSKGFRTVNSILVFAHQGTGFWGPPMRWFTDSEIAVIEFV